MMADGGDLAAFVRHYREHNDRAEARLAAEESIMAARKTARKQGRRTTTTAKKHAHHAAPAAAPAHRRHHAPVPTAVRTAVRELSHCRHDEAQRVISGQLPTWCRVCGALWTGRNWIRPHAHHVLKKVIHAKG